MYVCGMPQDAQILGVPSHAAGCVTVETGTVSKNTGSWYRDYCTLGAFRFFFKYPPPWNDVNPVAMAHLDKQNVPVGIWKLFEIGGVQFSIRRSLRTGRFS